MLLKINTVPIAVDPADCKIDIMDIDDGTDRNTKGDINRSRVAVKRKIIMSWNVLKWSEISSLLQQVSNVYFSVNYPDPQTGIFETKAFYVGDRSSPVAKLQPDNSILWEGLSMNFVER